MAETTVNRGSPAEWAPYFGPERIRGGADTVASHRATTSSRTPGKVNRGTIRHAVSQLVACVDCGVLRMGFGGPHAPHFANRVQVDCIGREVRR